MCRSLPGATFSALAMVWTCFLAIFPSLLGLTLPGGGSPYSMYASLVYPFSSGLDLQSISCPSSSLKLPLCDASVPALDACNQRWLWQYHTRSVQCFSAATLASCSLAQPACFRKALRTLYVHTERTIVFPFRTSNVIRSVRASHPTSCCHRKFSVPVPLGCQLARSSVLHDATSPLSEKYLSLLARVALR
jgi:hypothetical protein